VGEGSEAGGAAEASALSPSAMPLVRRKSAMELRIDFSEDPPLLPAKYQIRICK
jgi:hypothetical protein